MAMRNPANVLPEPVGAAIRTSEPACTSGHPLACASVAPSGKRAANQLAMAGCRSSKAGVFGMDLIEPVVTDKGCPI